jgi:acetyl esterase/lipase
MASGFGRFRLVLVSAVLVGGALGVARSLSRRAGRTRAARAAVARDLRHPVLFVDLSVADEKALARGRRMMALGRYAVVRRGPSVRGVEISDRFVAAGLAEGHEPRVRLYEHRDRRRPSGAMLWIHGGGMVMGVPEQDDPWLSSLADELGILVVSVEYRLATEDPYPAGLDDCMTAVWWLHRTATDLGVDPHRVAVGGSSAGGGLAAAVALRARDEGGPPLCFQLLNYPMLDDRTVLRVDHGGTGEFTWTPVSNRFGWSAYLGGEPREHDDRAHAVPARATDLSGLPPAWIGVGQLDLFHAEDVEYARRLAEAGVACELVDEPGMYHGADQLVPKAARMKAYRQSMVDALRRVLT